MDSYSTRICAAARSIRRALVLAAIADTSGKALLVYSQAN
jgi:hypothetical protein